MPCSPKAAHAARAIGLAARPCRRAIVPAPNSPAEPRAPTLPHAPSAAVTPSTELNLEPNDSRRLAALCGPFDEHIKLLESRLGIRIRNRGNAFRLTGPEPLIRAGRALLARLYTEADGHEALAANTVHLALQEAGVEQLVAAANGDGASEGEPPDAGSTTAAPPDEGLVRIRKRTIKARGRNQRRYLDAIRENDLNFGVGPAGTGKTYLAVACAVEALESQGVERILLVRPAVEAGEKLGFLPGDLAQKIDPYLRPLYDALYEMLGADRVHKHIERNTIEVAPLAFMRGRTLNGAFIILDESQNTTVEQMKMFLTRIGFGSTAVVTGDITQIDLPNNQRSGLVHVLDVLAGVNGVSFTRFSAKDVVRHPLVQRIVEAYARAEESRKA